MVSCPREVAVVVVVVQVMKGEGKDARFYRKPFKLVPPLFAHPAPSSLYSSPPRAKYGKWLHFPICSHNWLALAGWSRGEKAQEGRKGRTRHTHISGRGGGCAYFKFKFSNRISFHSNIHKQWRGEDNVTERNLYVRLHGYPCALSLFVIRRVPVGHRAVPAILFLPLHPLCMYMDGMVLVLHESECVHYPLSLGMYGGSV